MRILEFDSAPDTGVIWRIYLPKWERRIYGEASSLQQAALDIAYNHGNDDLHYHGAVVKGRDIPKLLYGSTE